MADLSPIVMEVWKWASRLIIGLVALAVFYAAAFWYHRTRRYNYTVRIFNRDALGHIIQQKDDAGGIFLDRRTQYRLFMIRRNKCALDPDEIPYIISSTGRKIVYLIQTGLKNFQYMKPSISANPTLTFNVQDEDVAWALNAYESHKRNFTNKLLEQIIPIIGMAFVFLLIVVAMYYIFQNFGELKETAIAFQQAAAEFARAKVGTVIVE